MKFLCDQCKAKYQIADEKVQGKSLRMKCRKCGHLIEIQSASVPPSGTTEVSVAGYPEAGGAPSPMSAKRTPAPRPAVRPDAAAPRPAAPRPGGVAPGRSPTGASPTGGMRPLAGEGALASAFKSSVAGKRPDASSSNLGALEDAPAEEWYVAIDEVPVGPIRITDLRTKYSAGSVQDESLVWRDGFEEWRPLNSLPELHRLVREEVSGANAPPMRTSHLPPTPKRPNAAAPRSLAPRPSPTSPGVVPARGNVIPFSGTRGAIAARKIEEEEDLDLESAEVPPEEPGLAPLGAPTPTARSTDAEAARLDKAEPEKPEPATTARTNDDSRGAVGPAAAPSVEVEPFASFEDPFSRLASPSTTAALTPGPAQVRSPSPPAAAVGNVPSLAPTVGPSFAAPAPKTATGSLSPAPKVATSSLTPPPSSATPSLVPDSLVSSVSSHRPTGAGVIGSSLAPAAAASTGPAVASIAPAAPEAGRSFAPNSLKPIGSVAPLAAQEDPMERTIVGRFRQAGIGRSTAALLAVGGLLAGVLLAALVIGRRHDPQVVYVEKPATTVFVPVGPSAPVEAPLAAPTETPTPSASTTAPRVIARATPTARPSATSAPTGVPTGRSILGPDEPPPPTDTTTVTTRSEPLDGKAIEQVIAGKRVSVRKTCYEPYADRGGASARIRLRIAPDGSVTKSDLMSSEGDSMVGRCVRDLALRWHFPPSGGGAEVTVPFIFSGA